MASIKIFIYSDILKAVNSEPSSKMLRSDSSELSTDQAMSGAGQARHKVTRKIEFRTSPRKVNIISCVGTLI